LQRRADDADEITLMSTFKTALSFPNRSIAHFDSLIRRQKELLHAVQAAVPETLAHHVQHCLLSGQKLLLYTDSAVWASQLRFYHETILAAIAPLSKNSATGVQIKIAMAQAGPSVSRASRANLPSSEQLAALHELCLYAPENELTQAFVRLAKTLADLPQPGPPRKTAG
jgi:hypothetical protein